MVNVTTIAFKEKEKKSFIFSEFCGRKLTSSHFVPAKCKLSGRARTDPHVSGRAGFQSSHRLLISRLKQRAATNQQNHMLQSHCLCVEVVSYEANISSALPVTCLPVHTLGNSHLEACSHAVMWIYLWVLVSIHPSSVSTHCHKQLHLSSSKPLHQLQS